MTYIRFAFFGLIGVVFVTVALANRSMVTMTLLPDPLAALLGFNAQIALPLFVLVGGAVVVGLLLGFLWEWLRERAYRAEAKMARTECDRLRGELNRVQKQAPETQKDDVLAIIEADEAKSRKTTVPAVS